jgi:hypothetical protein
MAPLTRARRDALPKGEFALPGGRYPIDTPARAKDALSRGAANATPSELATIRRKVHAKYPDMEIKALQRPGKGK